MEILHDQRISEDHLKRHALIYLRQSSPGQVKINVESFRLQLSLREKAISFGWIDPIIIDDDLGLSAAGFSERPGFQRLLTMVTMKQAGIIFCLEASRLSRNNTDWAQLFELCGFFNTLVADTEQVFNLNIPNDRMVLGIKGTFAEMELSIIKMRLKNGATLKAQRGELKVILPPGYAYDHNDKIVIDPDKRVKQAIKLLFSQFDKHTSVRQLVDWYMENNTYFPVRKLTSPNSIRWEIPKYSNIKNLLQHPIYAGVYAYGRRQTLYQYKNSSLSKKITDVLPYDKWQVLIKDHHEPYISWDKFLDIQKKISHNRPRWKMDENLGAIREGLALLVGLLRCGHCGRKLYVSYKTNKNPSAIYFCGGYYREATKQCLSFGAHFVDKSIAEQLLNAVKPAAIEAGFAALQLAESENTDTIKMAQLEMQNAQYQADRAFEQFDLVDPKNRLVAASLEKKLNERLVELKKAKDKVLQLNQSVKSLTEVEKKAILNLSRDFKQVWYHDKADPVLKKQLLRLFIREIMVTHDADASMLNLTIHWQGGIHTTVSVKKRKTPIGNKADVSLIEKVQKLAKRINDSEIARVLNMSGEKTPTGLRWSKDRVAHFRKHHRITLNLQINKSDVFSAETAAKYLGISRRALLKLVKAGLIDTNQVISFAPYEIRQEQLDSEVVQKVIKNLRNTGRLFPKAGCSKDQLSIFSLSAVEQ